MGESIERSTEPLEDLDDGNLELIEVLEWIESTSNDWYKKFRDMGISRTTHVIIQIGTAIRDGSIVRGTGGAYTEFARTFKEFQENILSDDGNSRGKWQRALLHMLKMCNFPHKQIQDFVPKHFEGISKDAQELFNKAAEKEGLPPLFLEE